MPIPLGGHPPSCLTNKCSFSFTSHNLTLQGSGLYVTKAPMLYPPNIDSQLQKVHDANSLRG